MGIYNDLGLSNKQWNKGDWLYINNLTWGRPEVSKIIEVLESNWFAHGKFNTEFEKLICKFAGLNYFQTTNSGSAGLEIAVQTLIQNGIWQKGDKILHPVCTFPTSISAAVMAGLIPVYCDVGVGTYVISDEAIEKAFEKYPDIKGAIIPALLGNAPNIDKLREHLGDKILIFDSCDVMGTKWNEQEMAGLGDFAAFSFYGSHTISTAGVGGGVGTNNSEWADKIKSITFWGRDFGTDNLSQLESFLKRYSYKSLGLDGQMTAIQAAFGIAQMDRLEGFIQQRDIIFKKLVNLFRRYQDWFIMPTRVSTKADVSWFCFPITLSDNAPFTREYFAKHLLDNKIEIRPIMAGNILEYAPFKNTPHKTVGEFPNAKKVFRDGFFIPACPMNEEQTNHYLKIIETFLKKYDR